METCTEIQSRREDYLFDLFTNISIDNTIITFVQYLRIAGHYHFVSSTFEGFKPDQHFYKYIWSCE